MFNSNLCYSIHKKERSTVTNMHVTTTQPAGLLDSTFDVCSVYSPPVINYKIKKNEKTQFDHINTRFAA